MITSVSNDGFEWSLDFAPDSVTLTLKGLIHEMTTSSRKYPLAAWSLLFSQRQDFLKNHLMRVLITHNQQRTMEMTDEVLSRVVAQDMDTSRYQVSDLDDNGTYWENDHLDVDGSFRPEIDTPFPQERLTIWREQHQQKTPFCSTKSRIRRTLLQQHLSLRN